MVKYLAYVGYFNREVPKVMLRSFDEFAIFGNIVHVS